MSKIAFNNHQTILWTLHKYQYPYGILINDQSHQQLNGITTHKKATAKMTDQISKTDIDGDRIDSYIHITHIFKNKGKKERKIQSFLNFQLQPTSYFKMSWLVKSLISNFSCIFFFSNPSFGSFNLKNKVYMLILFFWT